jgi:hypothetical protein
MSSDCLSVELEGLASRLPFAMVSLLPDVCLICRLWVAMMMMREWMIWRMRKHLRQLRSLRLSITSGT